MASYVTTDESTDRVQAAKAAVREEMSPAAEASNSIETAVMHLAETVHLLRKRLDPVLRAEGPSAADQSGPMPSADSLHTAALRRHASEIHSIRVTVEDILARLDV